VALGKTKRRRERDALIKAVLIKIEKLNDFEKV